MANYIRTESAVLTNIENLFLVVVAALLLDLVEVMAGVIDLSVQQPCQSLGDGRVLRRRPLQTAVKCIKTESFCPSTVLLCYSLDHKL